MKNDTLKHWLVGNLGDWVQEKVFLTPVLPLCEILSPTYTQRYELATAGCGLMLS